MAVKQPIFGRALFVDATITAGQLVKVTGDESVSPATAGTDVVIGLALEDGAVGEKIAVELFVKGVVEVVASGAVTAGAKVAATTAGKAKAFANGDDVIGVALKAATDGANLLIAVK